MKVAFAVITLCVWASTAAAYGLREPTKAPDGSTLNGTTRYLLACVHKPEGQYVDWLPPTNKSGGGLIDLTTYKPRTFPNEVRGGCLFCLPSGCPVWGPADVGRWDANGAFIPSAFGAN